MDKIIIAKTNFFNFNQDYEFVERKGIGHPDTLADNLAEKFSNEYSNYTLKRYGAILHHNFDKVGLLGGSSYVVFGKGYLINPIRVLINGRISTSFRNEKIPVRKLLTKWTKEFFLDNLPIDVEENLELHFNLSNQSSPGKIYESESKKSTRRYWFKPRGLHDLQELKFLTANDTSLGVGYAPFSSLEKIVLDIEHTLNSKDYKKRNKWIGSDIKIMAFRYKNDVNITICIPQIANFVKNLKKYKDNLNKAKEIIYKIQKRYNFDDFKLNVNTRDRYKICELYLTAIGSSIESGDEGLAGRGNRVNGVISPLRPLSMEGACGKNPVYYIGKIYYLAANSIANKIYKRYKIPNEIYLASQSGRDLLNPWITLVVVPGHFDRNEELNRLIKQELKNISLLTRQIIKNKFNMC